MSRIQAILAGLVFLAQSARAESKPVPGHGGDCVVLLHGLGRTPISMKRVELALRRENYRVINFSYASTRLSSPDAAARLGEFLETQVSDPDGKIHFVTHSLGGIVLRQYLSERKLENLGRVVMLAPPNQGSELADKLKTSHLYKFFTGPSGQQLGTDAASLPRELGGADYELGIIAGDRSLNPMFSACISGPNDGKVSVQSAQLEGMRDFLVVHHSHTWLPWTKEVTVAVARFLRCGRFAQDSPA